MVGKVLYIVRGLPGSGKSTLANRLSHHVFEADDYFIGPDGEYRFDPRQLGSAHEECLENATKAMRDDVQVIAVANTISQQWEAQPYITLAKQYGYAVSVVEAQGEHGSIHNVPTEKIEAMKKRWESITVW